MQTRPALEQLPRAIASEPAKSSVAGRGGNKSEAADQKASVVGETLCVLAEAIKEVESTFNCEVTFFVCTSSSQNVKLNPVVSL